MPDLKITQFTQIITLDDADVLAIVDLTDNTTKKVTILQLKGIAPVQSVNGSTGAVTVQAVLVSGTNIKTINSTSLLGSGNISVQAVLVSGTNIKTINGNSILGAGDLVVTTTPAGTDGQVQYNNGGAFGGASDLVYDDVNNFVGYFLGILKNKEEAKSEDYGVSWTLDKSIAEFFANSFLHNYDTYHLEKTLVELKVKKTDIIAYFNSKESEIIYIHKRG
jgi:hypothetical protein